MSHAYIRLAQKGVIGVDYAGVKEDSRMVRNLIRNQAWSNPLRVRSPCPPLDFHANCRTKPLLACFFLGLCLDPKLLEGMASVL